MSNMLNQSTLAARQTNWEKPFVSVLASLGYTGVRGMVGTPAPPVSQTADELGHEQKALLLLSTVGDYDAGRSTSALSGFGQLTIWARDRLRHLDLRSQFQTDSVYVIGFADDPGPVRLFRRVGKRYRPLQPDLAYSKSMYRIRIPARVSSRGDAGEQDELDELLESKGL